MLLINIPLLKKMFQAQQPQTVMYFPNQDAVIAEAQQPLSRVIVTGTCVSPDVNSIFHFRVSLVLPNDCSIHLNMLPSGVGTNMITGLLQIHHKLYAYSTENTITFSVTPALGGKTAAEVLTHILGNRRDKYTFNNEGYGCRYWSDVILQDLVGGNFIPRNALELFHAWEVEQHTTYGAT